MVDPDPRRFLAGFPIALNVGVGEAETCRQVAWRKAIVNGESKKSGQPMEVDKKKMKGKAMPKGMKGY